MMIKMAWMKTCFLCLERLRRKGFSCCRCTQSLSDSAKAFLCFFFFFSYFSLVDEAKASMPNSIFMEADVLAIYMRLYNNDHEACLVFDDVAYYRELRNSLVFRLEDYFSPIVEFKVLSALEMNYLLNHNPRYHSAVRVFVRIDCRFLNENSEDRLIVTYSYTMDLYGENVYDTASYLFADSAAYSLDEEAELDMPDIHVERVFELLNRRLLPSADVEFNVWRRSPNLPIILPVLSEE